MSSSRTRFKASSKRHRCPVCDGDHKCSIGNDGLIVCGRRQGPQPGFVHLGTAQQDPQYHLYRREGDPVLQEREREYQAAQHKNGENGRVRDWTRDAAQYQAALTPARRDELAADLGIRADVFTVLQVGWCQEETCWTFPSRDGTGKIVGINRRWKDGQKKVMFSGKHGLCVPLPWKERGGTIFCPEGPSDTLALWAMGRNAIGRPNNLAGVADLTQLLSDLPADQNIVILGEFDPKRNGDWPGRDGAVEVAYKLSVQLNRPVLFTMPPEGKDVRAWVNGQEFDRGIADCWDSKGDELERKLMDLARPPDSVFGISLYKEKPNTESETARQPPVIVPFSQLQAVLPEQRWIWQGYLARGNKTLLSALYKCGKTTLLSHLLLALSGDRTFCGLPVRKSKVLCVTEEHECFWADRRDRLSIGDHCHAIIRPFRVKPSVREWESLLTHLQAVQAQEHFDLIIFDTLAELWPVREENNASEVRAALMPLSNAIGDAALLLAHQFRKSGGEDGTASRGSGELMASVDIILELRRFRASEINDRRRVLTYRGRHPDFPAEMVIQLSDNGKDYISEGSPKAVAAVELRYLIPEALPDSPPGITVTDLLKEWKGPKPNRDILYQELRRGAESDPPLWQRKGEGKKGKPFTFWKEVEEQTIPFE